MKDEHLTYPELIASVLIGIIYGYAFKGSLGQDVLIGTITATIFITNFRVLRLFDIIKKK